MKEYIKMAWRNIWRNKRRALITIASVFFAVLLALLMRSMQIGSYDNMEKNIVELYTGYIQIHDSSYWDKKTINNTFEYSGSLETLIAKTDNVTQVIPRLESFALASVENLTKGTLIIGIDPEKETELTGIKDRLTDGKYLEQGDEGVLVADKLADYLKLKPNDTLILISQGYHGISAAGKYPVRGIIKYPNPELSRQLVYMDLASAQDFFMAYGRLTSLVVNIKKNDKLEETVSALNSIVPADYSVMSWKEMMVEVVQMIESDNASGLIMLWLLYLVIAFGILGTIIMMTTERRREFGVMVSVGMRRTKLAKLISIEALFLGILGTLAGIVVAIPIIAWFYVHPIPIGGDIGATWEEFGFEAVYAFAFEAGFFINQGLTVLFLTLLALIYPVIVILKLNPVKAMRA